MLLNDLACKNEVQGDRRISHTSWLDGDSYVYENLLIISPRYIGSATRQCFKEKEKGDVEIIASKE